MSPDPRDPPEPRSRRKGRGGGEWNWPGWLIAYALTLLVLRDILLTILQ